MPSSAEKKVLQAKIVAREKRRVQALLDSLPPEPQMFHSESIVDRKSCFIGHACRVSSKAEVDAFKFYLGEMKFGTVGLGH